MTQAPGAHAPDGRARPRRVFGIETEYGITAARTDAAPGRIVGEARPEPVALREPMASAASDPAAATGYGAAAFDAEEAAQRLFAPVLARARSTNRYLPGGGRLYLDVGAHPEFASAECSDPLEVLASDRSGEVVLAELVADANARLEREGTPARLHLFKNNIDSAGNSFGCHENYLVHRRREFRAMTDSLMSFLVTRQVLVGSGYVRRATDGTSSWGFSVRSDLVWDATSSATTRSRPIINTRDEPHGDAEKYRRLHIIAGDSNVAQATTLLKVAMTSLVLDLLEDGVGFSDLRLADETRAVRDVSHDITGAARIELADGRAWTAVDLQEEVLGRVLAHVDRRGTGGELTQGFKIGLDLWQRGLAALRSGDLDDVATELDWVAKMRLVERYRARSGAALDDPRVTRLVLAYHDVTGPAPLARTMERRGLLRELVTPEAARAAVETPPRTTRAHLRGAILARAQELGLDVAVDWVQVRVDGAKTHSLMLQDPFATQDARVDALLAEMERADKPGAVL